MSIALPESQYASGAGAWKTKLGNLLLIRKTFSFWCDFRKDQYLLSSSYRKNPLAQRMPRRTWDRRSALFMSMNGYTEKH